MSESLRGGSPFFGQAVSRRHQLKASRSQDLKAPISPTDLAHLIIGPSSLQFMPSPPGLGHFAKVTSFIAVKDGGLRPKCYSTAPGSVTRRAEVLYIYAYMLCPT